MCNEKQTTEPTDLPMWPSEQEIRDVFDGELVDFPPPDAPASVLDFARDDLATDALARAGVDDDWVIEQEIRFDQMHGELHRVIRREETGVWGGVEYNVMYTWDGHDVAFIRRDTGELNFLYFCVPLVSDKWDTREHAIRALVSFHYIQDKGDITPLAAAPLMDQLLYVANGM